MQIGQLVDLCIDYNNRQNEADKQQKQGKTREATQKDINAYFG